MHACVVAPCSTLASSLTHFCFWQVVGTFVLMGRGYAAAALQLLGELTYPSPKGIARLTLAVLLSSAALTLLVFGLDRAYMHVLLPPVARKLAARS